MERTAKRARTASTESFVFLDIDGGYDFSSDPLYSNDTLDADAPTLVQWIECG